MNYIRQYYKAIVDGDVVVSDKVRRTYKHLIKKLDGKVQNESQYVFDEKRADHVIQFVERFCRQSRGKWGGKPIKLELWQKALLSACFGFVDKETRLRQYKELVLIVARKNGKSTLASAVANYLFIADGEKGPEIYSAATQREQAKIIWEESKRMIQKSPSLNKRCKCLVHSITCPGNDGVFRALASESNNLDGLNVHGAFIDELHAIKDKNLYDVIVDGETSRDQPLTFITSTAGTVRDNIFDFKYDECVNIIRGYDDEEGYKAPFVLPIIYELDKRGEWVDEECWYKANPALGTVKSLSQLREKVEKAKENPIYTKNLLCKDFNIRETSGDAFFTYEQLNNETICDIKTLKPRYGIGGFDLSATTDLTNATLIYKVPNDDNIYVEQMYWIPEDLFEKRVKEDKVPYDIWFEKGYVRKSPGNRIDYRLITEWFREQMEINDVYIYKYGYDSWSARYLVEEMKATFGDVGIPVIQGKKTLSGPMKNIGAEFEAKRIIYNNNPVLKWCLANVGVDIDRNGNIQPLKAVSPKHRIDGFAGLLNAYTVYEQFKEDYENII